MDSGVVLHFLLQVIKTLQSFTQRIQIDIRTTATWTIA